MPFGTIPEVERPVCCEGDQTNLPPEYIYISGQDWSASVEGGVQSWTYSKGDKWAVQGGITDTFMSIEDNVAYGFPCHVYIHGIIVATKYSLIEAAPAHYINEGDDNQAHFGFVTYSVRCPGIDE
jgi:hypothetical protein